MMRMRCFISVFMNSIVNAKFIFIIHALMQGAQYLKVSDFDWTWAEWQAPLYLQT